MTRQKSRPPKQKQKKKQGKTEQETVNHHSPIASLDAFISSPFEASLALKSQMLSKSKGNNETESRWRPNPGALFSSGQCIIGSKKRHDKYTIRITKLTAAQAVLHLPPGTRIRLKNAKFVNSYGSKKYREISAPSFEIVDDTPRSATPSTPSTKLFIFPTEHGVKKGKVTYHVPMLVVRIQNAEHRN